MNWIPARKLLLHDRMSPDSSKEHYVTPSIDRDFEFAMILPFSCPSPVFGQSWIHMTRDSPEFSASPMCTKTP